MSEPTSIENDVREALETPVHVSVDGESHVGVVELNRPPNNYLDIVLLRAIGDALADLDADPDCRAVVLAAGGKHFCAGRDFSRPRGPGDDSASIYREAGRLLEVRVPIVAAVQGAAVGAGFGLAMCADFRLCAPRAYFTANFVNLGLHHGFGLSVTLPRVVGVQAAARLLYTGDRVGAESALASGLVDGVHDEDDLRPAAVSYATQLAAQPPLALQAIRATLRQGLAADFRAATQHESTEQARLASTADAREAAAAVRERRPGRFRGV
jgi:enoyl-CoA hydratase/carnithine racemase